MKFQQAAVVGAALLLASPGCGGPTPEEVRGRTSAILGELVRDAGDSIETAKELEGVTLLVDGLVAAGLGKLDDPGASMRATASEAAARLEDLLASVFSEANVEASSLGSTTFQVRGSVACRTSAEKADCASSVDRLQLRIIATLTDGEGVDLELRLGASSTIALIQLRRASVVVKLYLAAARDAAAVLGDLIGEPLAALPVRASGMLVLSLVRNAPRDITASASVAEAIDVEGVAASGGYRIKSEARDPLASVRVQAGARTLTINLDWGISELIAPARIFFAKAASKQLLKATLAGLTGTLTASPAAGISLTRFGLGRGKSSLMLDGAVLWSSELSPRGGTIGIEASPWQGLPRCTVSPFIDLAVSLQLKAIRGWISASLPSWALGERYRMLLSDSGGGQPEVIAMRANAPFRGGLKVLRGVLTIESELVPAKLLVAAGQCLTSGPEAGGSGAQPLLERLAAVPCP